MSNLTFKANITSYADADRFLGNRDSRKLAHNTVVYRSSAGANIRVKYHDTDIVTYTANEKQIEIQNGGWHTITTAKRLNHLLPAGWRVNIKDRSMKLNGVGLNRSITIDGDVAYGSDGFRNVRVNREV